MGTTPRGHAPAPLSDQRAGLRTEPRFARLLGAALLSGLGDQINRIAVLTVVYTSTRSGFIVSLSIAIRMAAVVVTGPVGAVLADRFPRKTLMVTSDLVRAGLAAALVWTANGRNLALLLVLIALIEASSAIFAPARSASIPNLVRERNLAWANGLDQSVTGLVMTLGSVCGGVAVAALGVRSAFLLNSASFVVSALLITTIPLRMTRHAHNAPGALRPAIRAVRASRVLRGAVVLCGLWPLAGGALSVLITMYAFETFQAGQTGLGLLYGALGGGYLLGGLLARTQAGAIRALGLPVAAACYLIEGCLYAATSRAPNIAVATGLLALGTTAAAVGNVAIASVLMVNAPDAMRGRVFGITQTLNSAGQITSMLAAGMLVEVLSVRTVGLLSGLTLGVTTLAVLLETLRHGTGGQARDETVTEPV